ncbi:cell division protein FtsB [Sporosarcina psychrophila]|uniref:Cell division protein FtsB n=1 Tax=Sporosarcina psychrophila TaxID=1476 RepID=A0ABV2K7I7_SPOPS
MQMSELNPRKTSKSVRSEEVLIKTLKKRIKALEEENKQLKDQVQKLHGKLF